MSLSGTSFSSWDTLKCFSPATPTVPNTFRSCIRNSCTIYLKGTRAAYLILKWHRLIVPFLCTCVSSVSVCIQVIVPDQQRSVALFGSVILRCDFSTSANLQDVLITWRFKSFCKDPVLEYYSTGMRILTSCPTSCTPFPLFVSLLLLLRNEARLEKYLTIFVCVRQF